MKTLKSQKKFAALLAVFTIAAMLVPFAPLQAAEEASDIIVQPYPLQGVYATLEAKANYVPEESYCPPQPPPCVPVCDEETGICKICAQPAVIDACWFKLGGHDVTLVAKVVNPTASTVTLSSKVAFSPVVPAECVSECTIDENGNQTCNYCTQNAQVLPDLNIQTTLVDTSIEPRSSIIVAVGKLFIADGLIREGEQIQHNDLFSVYMRTLSSPDSYYGTDLRATAHVDLVKPVNISRQLENLSRQVSTVDANVQQGTNDLKYTLKYVNNSVVSGTQQVQEHLTKQDNFMNQMYRIVKEIWYAVVKPRYVTPVITETTLASATSVKATR